MARSYLYPALAVLTLTLPLLTGCTGIPKCPDPPPLCLDLPCYSRNRVYVFLISNIDPVGHMKVLRQSLIDAGFIKVYNGHRAHGEYFAKEIEKIKECEEDARFVIVSQGHAAGVARDTARLAGVRIDVMVLLDETGVGPTYAERVLFIHGEKADPKDDRVAHQTICLGDAGLLGTAGHPEAAKLIIQELSTVAASVPVIEKGPKCELADCERCGNGWDFLLPDGQHSGCYGCKPMGLAAGALPATVLPPPPVPAQ